MLEEILKQHIEVHGPITQSEFMEFALQHPKYGYYQKHESVSKDFTTAPEVSQVFGELIGAWAIDIYQKLGQPHQVSLVELGPGKGTLMKDFLRVAQIHSPPFYQAINLSLIEKHPELRKIQKSIGHSNMIFAENFEDIPANQSPFIILANEFFDAIPTNYYIRKDNKLYERRLACKQNQLHFNMEYVKEDQGEDLIWEHSPITMNIIHQICDRLLKQSGIFLCIDYGYDQGQGDSLQALYNGEPSDPLTHMGESDLTCHVNFKAIKEFALSRDLCVSGPLPQGLFLRNLGLDQRFDSLKMKNPDQAAQLDAARTRLTHPQQMGSLFKVIAIYSPATLLPEGFES